MHDHISKLSREYLLYSDDECCESDQKEGGSRENSEDNYNSSACMQSRKLKRRVLPGMINDLNPVGDDLSKERHGESSTGTGSNNSQPEPKPVKLTQDQMYRFLRKRFERPTMGKYTQIFPFNKVTEQLSIQLNRQTGMGTTVTVTGPNNANNMKQLILEIKNYYEHRNEFQKGNITF